MPVDPGILGFSNVWYEGASDYASTTTTADGDVRHLDGPHFCATKLEAFASRAGGDLYHHDLEDVVSLVDERASLVDEIADAPQDIREFLAESFAGLLSSQAFLDALPGHLGGDSASQARLPGLLARLGRIAALRAPTTQATPPSIFPPPAPPAISPQTQGPVLFRSSNLRSAEYDAATSSLTIEFHGGRLYRYAGVPPEIYEGLLRAYSAGRYFHRWIRQKGYRFERLR